MNKLYEISNTINYHAQIVLDVQKALVIANKEHNWGVNRDLQNIALAVKQLNLLAKNIKNKTFFSFKNTPNAQWLKEIKHNLITHVSSIKGYSELIMEELTQDTMQINMLKSNLEDISGAADYVLALVDNMTTQNFLVSGRPPINGHIGILSSHILESELLQRRLVRDGNLVSIFNMDRDLDFNAMCDGAPMGIKNLDLVLLMLKGDGQNIREEHNNFSATVLKNLKDKFPYLPVIVLSDSNNLMQGIECLNLGAEDFLNKPYNPVVLQTRINISLHKKKAFDREQNFIRELKSNEKILKTAVKSMSNGMGIFEENLLKIYNQVFLDLFNIKNHENLHISSILPQFKSKFTTQVGHRVLEIETKKVNRLKVIIARDITVLHENNKKLHNLINRDSLTGILNRKGFKESLREVKNFSIIFIDCNKFKQANDTYGHQFGDMVLIEISQRLLKIIDNQGIVARLGGDEFACLLRLTRKDEVTIFVKEIIKNCTQPVVFQHISHSIGLSLGIASCFNGNNMEEILKAADMAMYYAKNNRLNYIFYDDYLLIK